MRCGVGWGRWYMIIHGPARSETSSSFPLPVPLQAACISSMATRLQCSSRTLCLRSSTRVTCRLISSGSAQPLKGLNRSLV